MPKLSFCRIRQQPLLAISCFSSRYQLRGTKTPLTLAEEVPRSRKTFSTSTRSMANGARQSSTSSNAQTRTPSNESNLPTTGIDGQEDRVPVLIIGSAIAGTVFALQLLTHPILRAQYRPIIFDGATTLPGLESFKNSLGSETTGQSGAAVALTKQAMWPLRKLQLGPELEEISQNTEELAMYRQPFFGPRDGSQKGASIVRFSAPPEVGILGGMWAIERGPLQALLIKKVLERGGEILPSKKLVKIIEHIDTMSPSENPSLGPIEAIFEDHTSYRGVLLIGANGAWSTVRKHLYTTFSPSGDATVDEAWKPEFQNLQIVHGMSHAPTTDTKPIMYSMGLRDAGCASWTMKGLKRQYWTIYTAPIDAPPSDVAARSRSAEADEALSREWGMQVYSGGYDRASTEALIEQYKNVWHPSAGSFGNLFQNSEKIIRLGLWQKLFTRLGNVKWEEGEQRPRECEQDMGVERGRGNIVLVGDAGRVLMPTSGQGAAFAIEDATVLANCILNNPPDTTGSSPNFSQAIKAYSRQRLPRYKRVSVVASFAARVSVGRTWFERLMRDYLAAWSTVGTTDTGEGEGEGQENREKGDWWWEKYTSDKWLIGERFEVRDEGSGGQDRERGC